MRSTSVVLEELRGNDSDVVCGAQHLANLGECACSVAASDPVKRLDVDRLRSKRARDGADTEQVL